MDNSGLVDITVDLFVETDKAIGVSENEDSNDLIWLPKSQIEYIHLNGKTIEITLPEWLALDKGLI